MWWKLLFAGVCEKQAGLADTVRSEGTLPGSGVEKLKCFMERFIKMRLGHSQALYVLM